VVGRLYNFHKHRKGKGVRRTMFASLKVFAYSRAVMSYYLVVYTPSFYELQTAQMSA
jgi:hypothetical protein